MSLRVLKSAEFRAALGFSIALVVFEALTLHLAYVPYLLYPTVVPRRMIVSCGLILVGYGLTTMYVWASLTATRRIRAVYFAVFALAVFLEYGYRNALGGFATADDLMVAFWGAVTPLKRGVAESYVSWLALVPSVGYVVLLANVRSTPRTRVPTLAVVLAALFALNVPVFLFVSDPSFRQYRGYPTTSLAGFFRSWTEVGVWRWRLAVQGPREAVSHEAVPPPANNIVLVIDESVRGDHLSLNGYDRATTPALDELRREGLLTNWGIAVAGANCSAASNRLLWVGWPSADLPAQNREIWTWPSIAQYAKAMGYRTHYFDGHPWNWLVDSVDLREFDRWLARESFRGTSDKDVDFAIADRVTEIVDASVGNFIWINKAGIHAPYDLVYERHDAIWTPIASEYFHPRKENVAALVNSYDNAIRYNVDGFFGRLDINNRRPGTVFLYTSDHGQSLSEQGESWTHCSDLRGGDLKRDREAIVPLFMIVAGQKLQDAARAFNRAAHANIFATVLDLMSVPASARRHRYWPSLLPPNRFEFRERYYFMSDAIEGQSPFGALARFDEPPEQSNVLPASR